MTRFASASLALLLPATLAAQGSLRVTVFNDRNGNGVRDAGERAIPSVVISNQRDIVTTDASGVARIERGPTGIVYVSVPNGYRSVGAFWRAPAPTDSQLTFALQPAPAPRTFRFVHGSDPHIAPNNVDRTRRFRQLVDSIKPDFTIVTGDLVFDAMSQQEPRARSFFELFDAETRGFANPLWTVPGNHDHFGIIPTRSHVPATHPLYNRGMYRLYRGPDYYSFNYGGLHFIALNTLMADDSAYYGRVDSLQLAWLERDLATVAPSVPIVTFNHIPMVSAWELLGGFADIPMVSSLRRINGTTTDRHTVANVLEVEHAMRGHPWVLALGGHMHVAEKQVFQTEGVATRFEIAAAIVGPNKVDDDVIAASGITLYTVRDGVIDAGRFVRLDPVPKP
ncbi:MAG TPA: metallophosphoesterase [Gemmatimonadaceae bacterium]|nr:metallophosphoesterase [Gemmatimonadaceae bacterium]